MGETKQDQTGVILDYETMRAWYCEEEKEKDFETWASEQFGINHSWELEQKSFCIIGADPEHRYFPENAKILVCTKTMNETKFQHLNLLKRFAEVNKEVKKEIEAMDGKAREAIESAWSDLNFAEDGFPGINDESGLAVYYETVFAILDKAWKTVFQCKNEKLVNLICLGIGIRYADAYNLREKLIDYTKTVQDNIDFEDVANWHIKAVNQEKKA